jgi:lipoyl(octanoyl) transferase
MSSEVETSRGTTSRQCSGIPRLRFASLGMTEKLFAALNVYREDGMHSAAMNMAIDEALLEYATIPLIRFYRWKSPSLSFGYFGQFADVSSYQGERDLVRRWTGGGIVFHGADLTYSLVIPVSDAAFAESSMSIYEKIHRALCEALVAKGLNAVVAGVSGDGGCSAVMGAVQIGISDASYKCFANPVHADLMIDGRKIAGAAQRRTCCGLLQQGSIQRIDLQNHLTQRFAQELSADRSERKLDNEILNRARELTERKYGTDAWLRKR